MRVPDPRIRNRAHPAKPGASGSRNRAHPAKPGASGQRAPREVVAAIIGAEAGAGIGLLLFAATPLAPLGLAATGALVGAGAIHARNALVRRWLRAQLRAAR